MISRKKSKTAKRTGRKGVGARRKGGTLHSSGEAEGAEPSKLAVRRNGTRLLTMRAITKHSTRPTTKALLPDTHRALKQAQAINGA